MQAPTPAATAPKAATPDVAPVATETAAPGATVKATGTAPVEAPTASTDAANAATPATSVAAAGSNATATAVTGVAMTPPATRANATVQMAERPAASAPSSAGTAASAVLALLLVVGLILLLAWLAKRMPGLTGATHPGLRVLGSVALGPRDRVVLVEVGETQLLVGVGAGGPRTLHTLDAPLPVPAPIAPSPFAQVLAQHFRKRA